MKSVQNALLLLVDAGKIVLPEVLEALKKSDDPLSSAQKIINTFPDKHRISAKEFLSIDPKIKISQPSPLVNDIKSNIKITKPRGKVPKRTYNNSKSHSLSIDARISKEIQNSKSDKLNPKLSVSKFDNKTIIKTSLDDLTGLSNFESSLEIIQNYEDQKSNSSINDMAAYFQDRFRKLSSIFRNRIDIPNITRIKDISRVDSQVSIIGMVTEKHFGPGKSGRLILEDPDSDRSVEIIIPKKNKTLQEEALHIMNDTVVCIVGYSREGIVIAKEILLPDVPNMKKRKRASEPVHVAFLSDIHVGSKKFLSETFEKFIEFLNGNLGSKKIRAIGKQTKYVLFGGDVVDGVGIYPNQVDDLAIDSIRDQYTEFARYLEKIPEDIQIVIIPGNHDMVRSAEPQPRIYPEYSPDLEKMKNVLMLSNPSQIALHDIQVLLYHCTSLPDIMNHIPGLPSDKPVEVMKQMLRSRHLAPIWGAKTPISTESTDHLVIEKLPDIFHGGHIHINGEGQYRGVQIVNSGTMQTQTTFQKSLNIDPTPGQLAIINLKTFQWSRINLRGLNP